MEDVIDKLVRDIPDWARTSAGAFNAILRLRLEEWGCQVRGEVKVPNRGDGRKGRIDLVIDHPEKIAIEVDRKTARKKSLFKLSQLPGYRPVSIIREP